MADSITEHGIIQPLTVRRLASGYYQIIAGERRWRAASAWPGLTEVPVIVMEADDRKAAELAMIENLQREDLNPMEEAAGLSGSHRVLSHDTRRGRTAGGKIPQRRDQRAAPAGAVAGGAASGRNRQLSAGHARALVPLSPALQLRAADTIIKGNLSVRQTELLVKRLSAEAEPAKKPKDADTVDYLTEAQNDLKAWLCRGVKIVPGRKKGRIELEYYGTDDLNDLLGGAGR